MTRSVKSSRYHVLLISKQLSNQTSLHNYIFLCTFVILLNLPVEKVILIFHCFASCPLKIEENKQRLDDLRKLAAEKAEIEWKEKKERNEKRQTEERDLEEKRKKLEDMRKEQEVAAEKERSLIQEEADKIRKHEEFLEVSLPSVHRIYAK